MKAADWNERRPVGTQVPVTLANGKSLSTRTIGPPCTWAGLDHVPVAGLNGYVLLCWVVARDALPNFQRIRV